MDKSETAAMNTEEIGTTNRKHKDRLFRLIFSEKKDLLELYNAIHGTHYTNEDDLEINTLEDVIYMSLKNDLSFIIGDSLNLYEHQSSTCGNMPLRGLFYIASVYRKYVKKEKGNLYGSATVRLPFPQYIVFYNGTEQDADQWEERLSDSFLIPEHYLDEDSPHLCLECTATVLNINFGHNRELMEKCQKLKEYAILVAKIRKYTEQELTIKEAVEQAIADCLQEDVLTDILTNHRWEVLDVILTEYDEAEHMEMVKAEGIAEGISVGRTEGIAVGRTEGIAVGRTDILIKILTTKSVVSEELKKRILAQKDLETLNQWVDLALTVKSLSEFEKQM